WKRWSLPSNAHWAACSKRASRWRRQVEEAVDVGEVVAKELVKLGAVGGFVLRPIPPAPVAAFGDQQLFKRALALRLRHGRGGAVEGLAGAQQLRPGMIILFGADPHVEIGADPRARENVIQRFRRHQTKGLAHGDGP